MKPRAARTGLAAVVFIFACWHGGKDTRGGDAVDRFECRTAGRDFSCAHVGPESAILPLWILHSKPEFRAYGKETGQLHAPKKWTLLEMRVYPDDQSAAPYDGVVYNRALGWVRACKGRAYLAYYYEGVEPPKCQ